MRSQPPLFLIHEACFLLLSFLCDYGVHGLRLHFSLFVKPAFYSLVFYATTTSAFPSPQSLFYVPQFFIRLRSLLFLLCKACFLFLNFLSDHGLHLSFHNATMFRIRLMTLYPKLSSPSMSKSVHYIASVINNIMP